MLIFGCGNVYEVGWLVDCGWLVMVIDFVLGVVVLVKIVLGLYVDVVELVDFFCFLLFCLV